MKTSTTRVLTTHTGSLPRPEALRQMLQAKDDGAAVDPALLEETVRTAVEDTVKRQADAGIDVVNDGEMSKISYSTYVKSRLSGFEGEMEGGSFSTVESREFPEFTARRAVDPNRFRLNRPACNGPISVKDEAAVQRDIANLKAAVAKQHVEDIFMSAASPGVIAVFLGNQYYSTYEEYIYAIATAMKPEYEAIAQAGFTLQLDCPDLAMSRHMSMNSERTLPQFLAYAQQNIEALNFATSGIPPEQLRMHLCWGNYEGPHTHDVPLKDIINLVFSARPNAISFEASNPRHAHEWAVFEDVKLPPGKLLIPGVLDSTTNFVEHPDLVAQRLIRFGELVGPGNILAGTDCGFGTAAAWAVVDARVAWTKLASMVEGASLASKVLFK